jgi:hypothetical protein
MISAGEQLVHIEGETIVVIDEKHFHSRLNRGSIPEL